MSDEVDDKKMDGISFVTEPILDSAQIDLKQNSGEEANVELLMEVQESTRKPLWGIAKRALGDASSRVSTAGAAAAAKAASLSTTGAAKAAEFGKQTFVAAGTAVEASGAKQAIKVTASVVSEKLDEVSGKRLVELVEKKLQLQDSYNNLLATRLAEALDRISILEEQVNRFMPRS